MLSISRPITLIVLICTVVFCSNNLQASQTVVAEIDPDPLNLCSQKELITVYLSNGSSCNSTTITLSGIDSDGDTNVDTAVSFQPVGTSDITTDNRLKLNFDRQDLIQALIAAGVTENMTVGMEVSGSFNDGTAFTTMDAIGTANECECTEAKVLFVRDDNHNNEDLDDWEILPQVLIENGMNLTIIDEPQDGLQYNDIKEYDIVWFTNPGHPIDDESTVDALQEFYNSGKAVVFQGDDLTYSSGHSFDEKLEQFTGLRHINNGKDADYTVEFIESSHPLLLGLSGRSITYTEDDIDSNVSVDDDLLLFAQGTLNSDESYTGTAMALNDETDLDRGAKLILLLTLSKLVADERDLIVQNIAEWLLSRTGACEQSCKDRDNDNVCDEEEPFDNCLDVYNPDQKDTDGDGIGDLCDEPDQENTPPVARFSLNPEQGDIETVFSTDAGISTDAEDATEQLLVRWDFETDGVWDTEYSTQKTATRQYDSTGTYQITLEVMDSGGLTSQVSKQVTVGTEHCTGLKFDLLEGRTEDPSRVYLFFSVEDCNGDPKDDLDADDFDIYEDDEIVSKYESDQTILPSPKLYTMSTVMLLDVSGSILGADALPTVKSSAKAFINAVSGDDGQEVAMYLFDGREELIPVLSYTKNIDDLNAAIDALSYETITADAAYDKSTNLNGAVKKGLSVLDDRRQSIDSESLFTGSLVVFTDGTDRAARVSDSAAVSAVQTSDHACFAIGLGGEIEEKHLSDLGKDSFVWSDDVTDLDASFRDIAERIKRASTKYYVLGYCSPKRAGSHTVTLKVTGFEGELDYAFSAQGFGPGCTPQAIESILYESENVQETGGCYEADFSVSTAGGTAPLTVQFQDASVESTSSYLWDFGDGSKSYEQNPSHTYTEPGSYTVVLTIDGYECTQENVITVTTPVSTQTCQAEYALAGRVDSEDTLTGLRSFRDNVLAKTPLGSTMTRLYYRHTDEIIAILQADQALKDAVAISIEALLPRLNALQAGTPMKLDAEATASVDSALKGLEEQGGVLLKGTLMIVRRLLYSESVLTTVAGG